MSQRPNNTQNKEKPPLLTRSISLQVSLPSVIGICIALVIGMVWVFIFGVMVGRGFEPEKKVPMLGSLMPSDKKEQIIVPQSVIKQEDLTFSSDLKSKPVLSTEEQPKPEAKPKSLDAKPTDKIVEKVADKAPEKIVEKITAEKTAVNNKNKYDFVFQVIAYKSKNQAENFREKIEGDGFRTRLVSEKDRKGNISIYRVQVLMRGTEADVENLKSVLQKYRIKGIDLTSKKPAS